MTLLTRDDGEATVQSGVIRRGHPPTAVARGVALVLVGAISVQAGGALAVLLFDRIHPLGVASVRLSAAAIVLLAICRPAVRRYGRAEWSLLVALGVTLAAMLGCVYLAIERIPLGAAVTLEVLGPLALSVILSRRALGWAWAGLAAGGVALLGRDGLDRLDAGGVVFALGAGALWALYILLNARAARRFNTLEGLAVAMGVAALVSTPLGVATAGTALLNPVAVGLAVGVALVATVVPYALDNIALRNLPESTFGVLMSLDPALATVAGLLILGQGLGPAEVLATVLVIVASMGAVATTRTSPDARQVERSAPPG